jgi:hypothetical protein
MNFVSCLIDQATFLVLLISICTVVWWDKNVKSMFQEEVTNESEGVFNIEH